MKQVKSTMRKCLCFFTFILMLTIALMTDPATAEAKSTTLHAFFETTGTMQYTTSGGWVELAKWGFKDDNGKVVIKAKYDSAGDFSEGLCAVQTEKAGFYINTEGEKVITFKDSYKPAIGGMFKDGTAVVQIWKNEYEYEQILIDKTGKKLNKTSYESISRLDSGFFECKTASSGTGQSQTDFLDKTGKVIIKAKDLEGKTKIALNKKGFVLQDASGAYIAYNIKGKKILKSSKDNYLAVHGNTLWKWTGKKYEIYNLSGKKIGSSKNAYREGYISEKGKVLINADNYDYTEDFIDGVALVQSYGRYCLINKKGKVIKELPDAFFVQRIASGLILLARMDGSQALMNTKGKYVFEFGEAGSFIEYTYASNGEYEEIVDFIQDGKRGMLSGKTGKIIIPAAYAAETDAFIAPTDSYRYASMKDSTGHYVTYDFDGSKLGSYTTVLSRKSL